MDAISGLVGSGASSGVGTTPTLGAAQDPIESVLGGGYTTGATAGTGSGAGLGNVLGGILGGGNQGSTASGASGGLSLGNISSMLGILGQAKGLMGGGGQQQMPVPPPIQRQPPPQLSVPQIGNMPVTPTPSLSPQNLAVIQRLLAGSSGAMM